MAHPTNRRDPPLHPSGDGIPTVYPPTSLQSSLNREEVIVGIGANSMTLDGLRASSSRGEEEGKAPPPRVYGMKGWIHQQACPGSAGTRCAAGSKHTPRLPEPAGSRPGLPKTASATSTSISISIFVDHSLRSHSRLAFWPVPPFWRPISPGSQFKANAKIIKPSQAKTIPIRPYLWLTTVIDKAARVPYHHHHITAPHHQPAHGTQRYGRRRKSCCSHILPLSQPVTSPLFTSCQEPHV